MGKMKNTATPDQLEQTPLVKAVHDAVEAGREGKVMAYLPLDRIDLLPQVRTSTGLSKESIAELADSLKEHGQMSPIIVRETIHNVEGKPMTRYSVVAGHRRVLAAREAKWTHMDAVIDTSEDAGNDASILQLVENVQREDLSPAEVAKGLRAIYDQNPTRTLDQFAKMIGKSKPWISKRLSTTFSDFSPFAKLMMETGKVADIEMIQLFNQLDKAGAGFEFLTGLRTKAEAGELTRTMLKDALADVKAKGPAPVGNGVTAGAAPVTTSPSGQKMTVDPTSGEVTGFAPEGEGDEEEPDDDGTTPATKQALTQKPKAPTLAEAVDVIETRFRALSHKAAKEYVDSLDVNMVIEICRLVSPEHDLGAQFRNLTTDEKLYGLASYAATNGGELNLASWVNGATKRGTTMPDLMRTMQAMADANEAARKRKKEADDKKAK